MKNTNVAIKSSLVTIFVMALTACAASNFSEIDGRLFSRSAMHLYSVRIVSIDSSLVFGNPMQIEPGPRMITLEAAPRQGRKTTTQRTFAMKIETCTRYSFAAQRDSITSEPWELIVVKKDKIEECKTTNKDKSTEAVSIINTVL
jgi:hypothetical protein